MTQLGGDFVLGPGALHAEYFSIVFGPTCMAGPICTFASRMQHAEDREHPGNDDINPSDVVVLRYRGFRTNPTLGNNSDPAPALPNANDAHCQREKSKKLR